MSQEFNPTEEEYFYLRTVKGYTDKQAKAKIKERQMNESLQIIGQPSPVVAQAVVYLVKLKSSNGNYLYRVVEQAVGENEGQVETSFNDYDEAIQFAKKVMTKLFKAEVFNSLTQAKAKLSEEVTADANDS